MPKSISQPDKFYLKVSYKKLRAKAIELSISEASFILLYLLPHSFNSYKSKTPCLILYSNLPPSAFFS